MSSEKSVDFSPSKRLFRSIIADYNLKLAICELIDNAIDINYSRKNSSLIVEIDIDTTRQSITVKDNAGGIEEANIRVILGPGHTTNANGDVVIGMFGVGSKRAVVAMAENIKISTRFQGEKGIVIKLDDDWLKNDDWHLSYTYDNNIQTNSTIIELNKLRNPNPLTDADIKRLERELGMVYCKFISDNRVTIKLNQTTVAPIDFENWSYPPKYRPTIYYGEITVENDLINVEIMAGLANISSPSGEYGVYFYCNDRLIYKALKDYNVGIEKSHPMMSLAKIVISLKGAAIRMPWNSSKSAINYDHEVFHVLRPHIIKIVKTYTGLSKRLDWPKQVFKFRTGKVLSKKITDFKSIPKTYLPQIPKSHPRFHEVVESNNKKILSKNPWLRGIPESVVIVEEIFRKKYDNKNRAALILLDSTLEIAFKEYLVNVQKAKYFNDDELSKIMKSRHKLDGEIKLCAKLDTSEYEEMWGKIKYYHDLKNKLFHERATMTINDEALEEFKEVAEKLLNILFELKFTDI